MKFRRCAAIHLDAFTGVKADVMHRLNHRRIAQRAKIGRAAGNEIGIDNEELTRYLSRVALSSVAQGTRQMGYQAAKPVRP
jgi:DNA-binding LacI/PurR family transcriptional regulator